MQEEWVEKLLRWADEYLIKDIVGKSKEELLALESLDINFKESRKMDGCIPSELEYLQNLHSLTLQQVHGLDLLPDFIARLKKLKTLKLVRISLRYILPVSLYIPTLEELVIIECGRNLKLPILQSYLLKMKKLTIHNNTNLYTLSFIQQFPNLEELEICSVPLIDFPRGIVNLSKLRTLILYYTQISILPSEIKNLQNLEVFACSFLEEIPEEICHLPKLKEFDYGSRVLKKLPDSIDALLCKGFIKLKNQDYVETIDTLYNKELLKEGFEIVQSYDEFVQEIESMKVITYRYKKEQLVKYLSQEEFSQQYQQMDRYIAEVVKRFLHSDEKEELDEMDKEYEEYLVMKYWEQEELFSHRVDDEFYDV